MADFSSKFTQLKRQIQSERVVSIAEKLEKNSKSIQAYVSELETLAASRNDFTSIRSNDSENFLSLRMDNPLCKVKGLIQGSADRDDVESEEIVFSSTAKLPLIERLPSYTTWIYLHRNQRMADDQSVVGRRRIYYDHHGSEALICSDSEEELLELEGEKHEFSEGEDRILRVAFQECGVASEVLDLLTHFVGGSYLEIQERCIMLGEQSKIIEDKNLEGEKKKSALDDMLEKSLDAALQNFNSLFCRRCLISYCPLHGHSHNPIYPSEKQFYIPDPEENRRPCGSECYLQVNNVKDFPTSSAIDPYDGSQSRASYEQACYLESKGKRKVSDNPLVETTHIWSEWKPLEKDLYLKGLEISGRNSCFIARNMLPGLKTCKEVFRYMCGDGAVLPQGSSAMLSSLFEDGGKADMDNMDVEMSVKSKICRKRGKARKVKSSWKSAGHPSLWRRIADGKDRSCIQYIPCRCQPFCGKDCSCLQSGNCCEKYCGCSKSCKNRFRGCHCAKSQCRSRQCPCFAAGRECDPDVCRNCWISCGDGSLREPPKKGDGHCGNMKLLLEQRQKVLVGRSAVAGWGAFIKDAVNKNDYLGEYTGELISHREADKRGKIYDRVNSSFLFDLNDLASNNISSLRIVLLLHC
ncbi:hypothetical protein ACJIZ3_011553 [Penstemon smallii]|uniref:CXC domain-containing protein n=1 Tax=Penstemon smallii TaxID=265156 RepID=A0ABD3UL38_9LAMI